MKEKVYALLIEKKYNQARKIILEFNAADIAEILEEIIEDIGLDVAVILFRMLPKNISVEVFSYLPNDEQINIISGITDKEIQFIMDELYFDDMIDVLEELPANIVKKILSRTGKEERKLINQFLNYPDYSAGSLMTIEYVGLKKEMTVKQAVNYIKSIAIDRETIYTCYVMDGMRKLEGIVSLRKIVISDDDLTIAEIMNTDVIFVNAYDDQEEIAQVFKKYNFIALPVVDNEKRLVGIITIDDVVDVIEQENTEDFQKMAAMSPSEKEYLDTSIFILARKRIVWLLVLMGSAFITASIISQYEDVLSSVVTLVAFMPLIMGTGGNAGAQSSTLIIRGMALGEIELKNIGNVVWKELRVSILVGLILSGINFITVYFLKGQSVLIAITVCSTLLLVVIIAKIVGGTLPIIAKVLKLDPAIMASPLITSIVDAVSVMIYFILAKMLLGI